MKKLITVLLIAFMNVACVSNQITTTGSSSSAPKVYTNGNTASFCNKAGGSDNYLTNVVKVYGSNVISRELNTRVVVDGDCIHTPHNIPNLGVLKHISKGF